MNHPDNNSHSPIAPAEIGDHVYRAMVGAIRDYAVIFLDPEGFVRSWNTGAHLLTGYDSSEILGRHISIFYPPDAIARSLPSHVLVESIRLGSFEDEGWRLKKDGSRFWANVIFTAVHSDDGKLIGHSKVTRDLTDRRQSEESVRLSEERFRSLVEGVTDYAIFMLDPTGVVTTWNAGAKRLKGYDESEIIGAHFSKFYPPDALQRGLPERELKGATLEGRYEDEGWRLRRDGSRFWANVILTAIRDRSGTLMGFSKITRDLTERRKHEEELELSEKRFRLLVEGVTEYAIIMLDSDGYVSSWNAGAERIKGYQSDEIIGKHLSRFYPSEDVVANKPWRQLATARETGRATDEGWRVRKDGSLFWAHAILTTLHDNEGHIYGFAKVTQDLTQRRDAENLAETAQRMHEFIAMLAHELRNPLAPIRNAIALMGRRGLGDPTFESMRQMIDRQSALLTRLLDELLDVNRIARGEFVIDRQSMDLLEVVARAREASGPLIGARDHKLHLSVPAGPIAVSGDLLRLTQALVNLLNNAAKYTPPGGNIWLTVRVDGSEAQIIVEDDGQGIPEDKLEQVFNLFMQVEPNSGSALGGLGVGLALVRRIVDLHGGSVRARGRGERQGTIFTLKLPLGAGALESVATTQTSDSALPVRRVLIVDDNKDAADSMNLLVRSLGQDTRVAYDGPSALIAAKTFKPELVFLDIGMPHMSGYQVAKQIRSGGSHGNPTLVAITGWGQEADRHRALAAGFNHHFVKPISEANIRKLLSGKRLEDGG
ncbi:MAG: PAS domain S-box protein [Steroidobacteraceae bacterium]